MSLVRRFAQIFGVAYPLVGPDGFVPPRLLSGPSGTPGPFEGLHRSEPGATYPGS